MLMTRASGHTFVNASPPNRARACYTFLSYGGVLRSSRSSTAPMLCSNPSTAPKQAEQAALAASPGNTVDHSRLGYNNVLQPDEVDPLPGFIARRAVLLQVLPGAT